MKNKRPKYRKIDPRIWNDEKFYAASLSCQHLFLFLLTHPLMTPVGAMRCTPAGLAEELDWDLKGFPEAFPEAFAEGSGKGFWIYDRKAKFLRLTKFMKYNQPESPNVVKSWVGCWNDLPECTLKNELYQDIKDLAEGLGEAFAEAFREAFREDYRESGAGTGTVNNIPPYPPSGGNGCVDGDSSKPNPKTKRQQRTKALKAEFEDSIWKHRWRRPNENRQKAEKAFLARRRAGVPLEDLVEGMNRYREFVAAGGVSSPRFAKSVETFLGPDRHWEQAWGVPEKVPEDRYQILALAEQHDLEVGDLTIDQARREVARATGMTL